MMYGGKFLDMKLMEKIVLSDKRWDRRHSSALIDSTTTCHDDEVGKLEPTLSDCSDDTFDTDLVHFRVEARFYASPLYTQKCLSNVYAILMNAFRM